MQHDPKALHSSWHFLKLAMIAISGFCPSKVQIDEAMASIQDEEPAASDWREALLRFAADRHIDPSAAGAALRNFILDRTAAPMDGPDWQRRKDCGHD